MVKAIKVVQGKFNSSALGNASMSPLVKSWASRQETYTDMSSPTCCDCATLPHKMCMWGWLKVLVQRNWWFKFKQQWNIAIPPWKRMAEDSERTNFQGPIGDLVALRMECLVQVVVQSQWCSQCLSCAILPNQWCHLNRRWPNAQMSHGQYSLYGWWSSHP